MSAGSLFHTVAAATVKGPGADDGLCPLHHQFHGVSGPQV